MTLTKPYQLKPCGFHPLAIKEAARLWVRGRGGNVRPCSESVTVTLLKIPLVSNLGKVTFNFCFSFLI